MSQKRLRMFAGPNGSGKSTVYDGLKSKFNLGFYINADEIEKKLDGTDNLSLSHFGINKEIEPEKFSSFLQSHSLYKKATDGGFEIDLNLSNGVIINPNDLTHSYEAAILADFIRQELINEGKKLSFETVMSHYSKIETLKLSKKKGYKNYLYFISTENVEINKERVLQRVQKGGHPVPEDKIESRYYLSLDFLSEAVMYTHKAFIFDNSGEASKLILSIEGGNKAIFHSTKVPIWIDKYLINKS